MRLASGCDVGRPASTGNHVRTWCPSLNSIVTHNPHTPTACHRTRIRLNVLPTYKHPQCDNEVTCTCSVFSACPIGEVYIPGHAYITPSNHQATHTPRHRRTVSFTSAIPHLMSSDSVGDSAPGPLEVYTVGVIGPSPEPLYILSQSALLGMSIGAKVPPMFLVYRRHPA